MVTAVPEGYKTLQHSATLYLSSFLDPEADRARMVSAEARLFSVQASSTTVSPSPIIIGADPSIPRHQARAQSAALILTRTARNDSEEPRPWAEVASSRSTLIPVRTARARALAMIAGVATAALQDQAVFQVEEERETRDLLYLLHMTRCLGLDLTHAAETRGVAVPVVVLAMISKTRTIGKYFVHEPI